MPSAVIPEVDEGCVCVEVLVPTVSQSDLDETNQSIWIYSTTNKHFCHCQNQKNQ